jgi:hypothetical protein
VLPWTEFAGNACAENAYYLAAQIRPVPYQQPCSAELGHRSLLDCFTRPDKHAAICATCMQEAIFSYQRPCRAPKPSERKLSRASGRKSTSQNLTGRPYSNVARSEVVSNARRCCAAPPPSSSKRGNTPAPERVLKPFGNRRSCLAGERNRRLRVDSRAGKRAVSASGDQTLKVWDLESKHSALEAEVQSQLDDPRLESARDLAKGGISNSRV